MKKRIGYILGFSIMCFCPLLVNATSANSSVWSGTNPNECSRYQDSTLSVSDSTYFSHCMEARCPSGNYSISYYSNNKVVCSNGNSSPYQELINSACPNQGGVCNKGIIKYCSQIVYYDCTRTSSGASYYTTTKTTTTKKRTTRKNTTTTTTTTTTEALKSNTKLKALTLSSGKINFSSDVYEYSIEVDSIVNAINITAVPEDDSSKVNISNNTNIVDGSVISVVVTGIDGSTSEYKINVKKKETVILSSNAKLKSLTVENYSLNFNSKITDYTLIIDEGVDTLKIDYETEDDNAKVLINGNENLKKGSIVKVVVTAEDGTVNEYKIQINVKKKSNFIKILFIIILVLSIIAGAYYIYKKFVASKSGEKYEYE